MSEHARHSAILIQKWLQSSSHWNFPRTVRRFFSRGSRSLKLLSVFFCLISAASHQRPDARCAYSLRLSWAGSAAAMGGGCLSERRLRHVAISHSQSGIGKRRAPHYCRKTFRSATFSVTTVDGLRQLPSLRLWWRKVDVMRAYFEECFFCKVTDYVLSVLLLNRWRIQRSLKCIRFEIVCVCVACVSARRSDRKYKIIV